MAEKRGQYQYNDDGSIAQLVGGDINLDGANAAIPVDIQARYSESIQTHNAVSVGASGFSNSVWIVCDKFDKIAVTMFNDATTNSTVGIHWSFDGVNQQGDETILPSSTTRYRSAITDTKAPFCRIWLNNTDVAAHTMSAWVYLKA